MLLTKARWMIILNQDKVSEIYPFHGPHGSQLMPDHHTRELVDNVFIPYFSTVPTGSTKNTY